MSRQDRRRSAEAKALGTALYRQRKIDVKRRKILTELEEKEKEEELEEALFVQRFSEET